MMVGAAPPGLARRAVERGPMPIRDFRPEDAPALVRLSATCARGEADFVLNPLWESEQELFADFERHRTDPAEHLLVAEMLEGHVVGLAGFLRSDDPGAAGMLCPIVARDERGHGLGGELLRAALERGSKLGIRLATAAIGTRNRAGYALLSAHGFRPVRQHFLMRCNEKPAHPKLPVADLELAPAEERDLSAILAIYSTCGFGPRDEARMAGIFRDGLHAHAVARHGGRVVAFAELDTHWPERIWVAFVGVATELRDRGVGSTLVAWAVARRFEAGATSALLLLSPANRTALRAYEKVGFKRHRVVDVLERGL
jgi:ribosomal protein S18 acetylase RimI-like enzyme